jgi:hypothetical protein
MEKVVFSKDQNVADCEDSDSSDKENTDIKRRKVSPWEVVQTFANKPEGEQFLKSDWVYYTKYNTNHGEVSVYKCRVSSLCPNKRRIVCDPICLEVMVHKNDEEHDHSSVKQKGK